MKRISVLQAFCVLVFFNLFYLKVSSQVKVTSVPDNKPITRNPAIYDRSSGIWIPKSFSASPQPNARISSVSSIPSLAYPIDDCATYTFRMLIGDAASDNHINNIYGSSTSYSYQAGYTTINGTQDALFQQLDGNGQVVWSKTFGSASLNESIKSIGQLPDGNIAMTGTIENTNGTNQHPFVAVADQSGTILWMKSIQTTTDYRAVQVLATRDGAIGTVAEDDSTMLYSRFDESGNMLWLKKVQALSKSHTVGIVGDLGDQNWFIAYTGASNGHNIGGILVINSANGSLVRTTQLGGSSNNSDFIFHSITFVNLRSRITGIYSENNQPYQLFRVSSDQSYDFATVGLFEKFSTPGISFDPTASSVQSAWGEAIAFKNSSGNNDLYAVKSYGSEEAYPIIGWRKKFQNIGPYSLSAMDRVFDAGFLIACNGNSSAAPYSPVYSIKVDSAGLSPGCDGTDYDIVKINTYNYPVQAVSLTPVTVGFSAQQEVYNTQASTINVQFTCKNLTCPPKPVEDTCVNTFYREFRSNNFCDIGNDVSVNANNQVLVIGSMRNNPIEPETEHGILAAFNQKGKLVNRKKVKLGDGTYLTKQWQTADGNILVLGSSGYNNLSYLTVTKYTPGLTMLWTRALQIKIPSYSAIYQVLESNDGSIFVWYLEGLNFFSTPNLRLLKLDASGNLLWLKNYNLPSLFLVGYEGSICEDDQYLYTANQSVNSTYGTFVMKIDKTTGNVAWIKNINGPASQTNLNKLIQLFQDKILLSGFVNTSSGNSVTSVVLMDKSGNIQTVKSFDYNNTYISNAALVTRNNNIVLSGYFYDNSVIPFKGFITFLRLDQNLQVLFGKRIFSDKPAVARGLAEATDGGIYETGVLQYFNDYLEDLYLKKYDFDGTMGNCMSDVVTYNQSTVNITSSSLNVTPTTIPATLISLPYVEDEYSLQQNQLICSSPVTCLQPNLTGPKNICSAQNIFEYRVQRSLNCTSPVSWVIDPAQLKMISSSDSLLKVQFKTNGSVRIKAGVFSGCRWLQDSIDIIASIGSNVLNLGTDTSICTGNTLLLNAHKGFSTYTWQDGSTDSTFKVTQPGKYYVATTDGCGSNLSDTIYVSAAPPIPFDLGADRNICSNEQISITAPAGFLNYTWTPNYNISSTTNQTAALFPLTDTMYHVTAEKTPGCFAYDSIRIFVKPTIPINLGNDTSFCAGNTIILNAGNNFQQYIWSNGATTATISITASGTFSIKATTSDNCASYDTIRITVFNNPVIKLPKDSLLCYGSTKTLDAGAGFKQYLWQNGSTNQQLIVQNTGTYWVKVTDQNNCTATDTSVISRLMPLPSAFLPPDTTICTYAKLELKPKNSFSQYLWSTNAISPSITIQQPGLYWLQVTDDNNCAGRDSIMINPKQCLTGFFVPNAFTPDKDGRNDIFKPVILGAIVKYELTIYNRWGQRVFQSSNWQMGWDGTVGGKPQDSNTFVWTCTYQFENEPVKFEKGTVTLVR